ncbi:MAG: fibrillarin-like rRNA/tRNA 2'-O-methyltransferase [Thaumarchaeota archaeon]|nr:fibrillarin-like rRNA/tRNA 2'-O-methyltransferase [Nitrososphaerota archaeon]
MKEGEDLVTKGEEGLTKEEDSILWVDVDGERRICTENLSKGVDVYGERLIKVKGVEYRVWDPFRSKLAVAIIKGLKYLPIKYGIKVLYLGASTGTTASHVSDIVGSGGLVFCVESASRVARELIARVATYRSNIIPIIEDARKPNAYFSVTGKVDVVYCDIAQPDQTEIAMTNCKMYLKKGGYLILVIKTRSIDVTKEPKYVVDNEVARLRTNGFDVEEVINLQPFDKDHAIAFARYS